MASPIQDFDFFKKNSSILVLKVRKLDDHFFLIGQYFLGSIKYSHQSCFFGAVWSGMPWDLCPVSGKANLIFTDMPTNAVTES